MRILPIVLLAVLLLPGCFVLTPRLPVVPPPPNQPFGLVLLEVPGDFVSSIAQDSVREHRDNEAARLRTSDPDLVRRILAHQITVGMSLQETIWVFLCHPMRVRFLGPPGGYTLLWEPDRYFVRFDEAGRAVGAGRY